MLPEYSRSRLQGWLKAGRVTLNGDEIGQRKRMAGGEVLRVEAEALPQEASEAPEAIALDVVFEDAHLLVINKPVGLVVHPGSGNWSGTLFNALLHHAPALAEVPRGGIVHRLDKDTSGLMVVAKTVAAQAALVDQLQGRSVGRHYLALVHGEVSRDGEVDAPIGRHPVRRTRMAVVEAGREARTRYTVRRRFAGMTLLECQLDTGRTHQIRVHMSSVGHPLVGDRVYGARRRSGHSETDAFPRQALHAFRLQLEHPAHAETMAWEVPMPDDIAALLAILEERERLA